MAPTIIQVNKYGFFKLFLALPNSKIKKPIGHIRRPFKKEKDPTIPQHNAPQKLAARIKGRDKIMIPRTVKKTLIKTTSCSPQSQFANCLRENTIMDISGTDLRI